MLKSCLKAVVTESVGYEAQLADISYCFQTVDDLAVRIKITGYSDTIFDFAKIYLDTMIDCAKPGGFDKNTVMNSMDKKKTAYQNANAEADIRATNNRLLFLVPHSYHATILAQVLSDEIDKLNKDEESNFDPAKFLQEKILDQIISI